MTRGLRWLLAASGGLAVANLYYHQPLLAELGTEFGISSRELGIVSMLAQIGYAAGMLFVVPLGDAFERRRLIVGMLLLVTVALVLQAVATSWIWLAATCFAIGFTTVSPQLIIPLAANLARPEERGAVVGSVMSGLLLGILLSRTASGALAHLLGWRAVYWIAAALMAILAAVLARALPVSRPERPARYGELMGSLWPLLRRHATVREAAFIGATLFASFSAFWTTLALYLASPVHRLGPRVAGMFGLVGAAGALAASLAGRGADRGGARTLIMAGAALMLAAFGIFLAWGASIAGLVVGVVLLDLGLQAAHVSNLSRVYALDPEARSRLNTIYMVTYFLGGALGSEAGARAWDSYGWTGVCAVGLGFAALAGLAAARGLRREGAFAGAGADRSALAAR